MNDWEEMPSVRHRPHRIGRRGKIRRRIAAYREMRSTRPRRGIPRVAVPSFFTIMNLFSGFLAIIQVFEGNLVTACWLIVLAGFFDMLDGIMARIARATSDFGIELDSLCDIVSFGVAPSILIYAFGLYEFGTPGVVIAALPLICGSVRLARYNLTFEGEKKGYFNGLPIPAQAFTLVSFVLTFDGINLFEDVEYGITSVLIPLVVILSALMVSNVKFDAIPKLTPRSIRAEPWKPLGMALAIILILFFRETGLFISLAVYIFFSLGRSIYSTARAIWDETSDRDLSEDYE